MHMTKLDLMMERAKLRKAIDERIKKIIMLE